MAKVRGGHPAPADAEARRSVAAVICYPSESLPQPDLVAYRAAREGWTKVDVVTVPPRDARSFTVPAGHFFRILSVEGPQVGDLNLWSASDRDERFFSGKTRALHGTHLSTGDRLWSCLPHLRPMATITTARPANPWRNGRLELEVVVVLLIQIYPLTPWRDTGMPTARSSAQPERPSLVISPTGRRPRAVRAPC